MEPRALEDALLDVARRVGVDVRREPFDAGVPREALPRGGLCVLRGARVIFVDASLSVVERTVILTNALAGVSTEAIAMPPFVRARIDLAKQRRLAVARPRHLRRVR